MKKILLTSVLAGSLLFAPQAQAINEEWSAALGFLGGLLVAKAADCDKEETRVIVREKRAYSTVPIEIDDCRTRRVRVAVPSGYYKTRVEKHWVPGRRVVLVNDCGRKVVRYIPGHFETRETLIWVEEY